MQNKYYLYHIMKQQTKKDFLWTIKTPRTLQLWPTNDKELSLTKPYLPIQYVNTKRLPNIIAPSTTHVCWLEKYDFEYVALSTHSKEYYSERIDKEFSTIMFTISGNADLVTQEVTYKLKKGTITLSPISSSSTLKVRNNWQVLWFHIKKKSILNTILGKKIISQKSMYFDEVVFTAKAYAKEVYKDSPDIEILQNLAKLLHIFIRREISDIKTTQSVTLTEIAKLATPKNATRFVAKKMGISEYQLNKTTTQQFGTTFSKMLLTEKMTEAERLLLTTKYSIAKIALKIGYANSQSFSKAFSKIHEMSPRLYRKKSVQLNRF